MNHSSAEGNGTVSNSPYSPNWRSIWKGKVPSKPSGLWTRILDFVPPQKKLKIVAMGEWNYIGKPKGTCGPDGDPALLKGAADCISQEAPIGALIGKLGWSTAGKAEGTVFSVGQWCFIETKDDKSGALFLTMNDVPSSFTNHEGELEVEVFAAM